MNLKLLVGTARRALSKGVTHNKFTNIGAFHADHQEITFALEDLSAKDLSSLERTLVDMPEEDFVSVRALQKLRGFVKLRENAKYEKVKMLDKLAVAIKAVVEKLTNKWLFKEMFDGTLAPCFVSRVQYYPPERRNDYTRPAYVQLDVIWVHQSKRQEASVSFHRDDLKGGVTVPQILREAGYYVETKLAVAEYMESVTKYKELSPVTGRQCLAVGQAELVEKSEGYWSWYYNSTTVSLEQEGVPTRVVVDDIHEEESEDEQDRRRRNRRDSDAEATMTSWTFYSQPDKVVPLPIHPVIRVFDMEKHRYVKVHVDNLSPYKYSPEVATKLVLSKSNKRLIEMLVGSADLLMEDIISGKTGGIIVLATGQPGTGKTLTAECFSQLVKKPLYSVQCSQLGTDEESIEKNLALILGRASRWGALLLIDECDVFVRARGNDISQNAIVGIFLRTLEYYRGVLFMTSNRATIIDDAILSRATAHVRYKLPEGDDLAQIWRVLSKQFNVKLSESEIKKLLMLFPKISGRSVKNLLKLARLLSIKEKSKIDVNLIRYVSKFQDIEQNEEQEKVGSTKES